MPNVRASSGMIGTTRGPTLGSRHRFRSRRVKAMVVDTSCLPDPASTSSKGLSSGRPSGRLVRTTRAGSGPSRALRRPIMYSCSSEPSSKRM